MKTRAARSKHVTSINAKSTTTWIAERRRKREREREKERESERKMSIGESRGEKKRKKEQSEKKRSKKKKVAAQSPTNVATSARTQSSPSIGATALTAWAPRNPINKYYNGTPREVGAQHILLSPPPPPPSPSQPSRAPVLAPSYSSSC